MSINKTNYSIVNILFRAKHVTNSTSDAQLSKLLGINPTTLSSWKSRGIIPYAYMYALAKEHKISFDWIITGEGSKDLLSVKEESKLYTMGDFVQLTTYKNKIMSSKDSESLREYDMSKLVFPNDWFSKRQLNRDKLVVIDIIGDSMKPEIPDGSVVLVDTTQKDLKNGKMYVFNIDGDLLIKTIIHDFDGYCARSKNPDYPDIRLNKDKIDTLNIVGRAVRAIPDIKL